MYSRGSIVSLLLMIVLCAKYIYEREGESNGNVDRPKEAEKTHKILYAKNKTIIITIYIVLPQLCSRTNQRAALGIGRYTYCVQCQNWVSILYAIVKTNKDIKLIHREMEIYDHFESPANSTLAPHTTLAVHL